MTQTMYKLSELPYLVIASSNYNRFVRDLLKDGNPLTQLDAGVADIILLLNEKGYETTFSCSGLLRDHWVYDDWIDENYVQYLVKETGIGEEEARAAYLKQIWHRGGYIAFKDKTEFQAPKEFEWSHYDDNRQAGKSALYLNMFLNERWKWKAWADLLESVKSL